MTFLTFSLFGAGLVSALVPLVLHWFMRGKPKKLDLPTLRFVRQKFDSYRRRTRFRHLILAIVRMAILVSLGLALSRPSFLITSNDAPISSNVRETGDADSTGIGRRIRNLGSRDAPVAAAIVVDSSVRSGYRLNNQTRLDAAKERAKRLASQLPRGSRVAILDSTGDSDSFQVDFLAAQEKLDQIEPAAQGRSVVESVVEAVRLLQTTEIKRREIVVLTDRTAASWAESLKRTLIRELQTASDDSERGSISLYLVDLACENVQNSSVLDLGLLTDAVSSDQKVRLDVELFHEGTALETIAELYLSGTDRKSSGTDRIADEKGTFVGEKETAIDGEFEKIAAKPISFPEGKSRQKTTFFLSGLNPGFYQGFVRLTNGDPLEADNVRWFSLEVQNGWKILVVAAEPASENSIFVQEALAPTEFKKSGRAPFDLETTTFESFESSPSLDGYRAVLLLDPRPLSGKTINQLTEFARNGGGVGFFLGRRANPIAGFQTPEATTLLGCRLTTLVRKSDAPVFIRPDDYRHPILAAFRSFSDVGQIPWGEVPVEKYWLATELSGATIAVANFDDGRPAILARPLGRGQIVVATTPVSDLPDRSPWNLLPIGEASWIYLMLMDGIARNLTSGGSSILNYFPNEVAIFRLQSDETPPDCLLTLPDRTTIRLASDVAQRRIAFSGTRQVGLYRLTSDDGRDSPGLDGGFAVNYRAAEFNLDRRTREEIDGFFGDFRPVWIDEGDRLEIERTDAKQGRELFPFLVVLLGLFLGSEIFFANRFYR